MKKRIMGLLLCLSVTAVSMAGCKSLLVKKKNIPKSMGKSEVIEEGDELNIFCNDDEFLSCLKNYYPGYKEIDDTTGKIGNITVNWTITEGDSDIYQDELDSALKSQKGAPPEDKIDIFLVKGDYASKYADSEYAMSLDDIGIKKNSTSGQYAYTKEVMTDSEGVQRGVSWQSCPGVILYNRDIAKKVLGSDNPEKVQKAVGNWDEFIKTAKKMKEKGYKITPSANDIYNAYTASMSSKWVENGKIKIDDHIMKWVSDSKKLVNEGKTGTCSILSDEWKKDFYSGRESFCCFVTPQMINSLINDSKTENVPPDIRYGIIKGPQSFYMGGNWICAAQGTDNKDLIRKIMLKITCDQDIMTEIAKQENEAVNNKYVMEEMSKTQSGSEFMGGQNPYKVYLEAAKDIKSDYISPYDYGCRKEFQKYVINYLEGNADLDSAIEEFYESVEEMYPELTH